MVHPPQGFMRRALSFLARTYSSTAMPVTEAELRAMSHRDLLAHTIRMHRKYELQSRDDATEDNTEIPPRSPPRKKRKTKREFDMQRYGQRMIALKFVYFGWPFHGFASQPHSQNTVEHHLFAALTKAKLVTDRDSCMYSRAGRTDVGVSAMGQVVGVRVRSNIVHPSKGTSELSYATILNSCLPPEIRVLNWAPVSDGSGGPLAFPGDLPEVHAAVNEMQRVAAQPGNESVVRRPGEPFSARFDALHRSYKYFFIRGSMDIDAMRVGGAHFVGTHNFRNFCKADENITNFDRHMYAVEVRRASDHRAANSTNTDSEGDHTIYYIYVKGQAFLWHQVRCMAAILFEVGRKRESPDVIYRMLDDVRTGYGSFSKAKPQYRMASPRPLLLHDCVYPPSVLTFPAVATFNLDENKLLEGHRPAPFARADADLAQLYATSRLQAAVAREMLSTNDDAPVKCVSDLNEDIFGKSFADVRTSRSFLLDVPHSSKHVPLDIRAKEMHTKDISENNGTSVPLV